MRNVRKGGVRITWCRSEKSWSKKVGRQELDMFSINMYIGAQIILFFFFFFPMFLQPFIFRPFLSTFVSIWLGLFLYWTHDTILWHQWNEFGDTYAASKSNLLLFHQMCKVTAQKNDFLNSNYFMLIMNIIRWIK